MSEDHRTARDIAESLLTETGDAMQAGDFDRMSLCFEVPNELETFEGRRTIESRDALVSVFRDVYNSYRMLGVTDAVRNCVEADFKGPDVVMTTHVCRLLSGTTLIKKPYPVFSVLRRTDDRWRIVRSQYAIVDAKELSQSLCPT